MWKKTKAATSGRKPEEVNIQYTDTTKHIQELEEQVKEQEKALTRSISTDALSSTYTSHRYNYAGYENTDIRDSIAKDTDIQMLLIDVLNKFNETGEVEGPEWKRLIKEITQYKEKKMNLREANELIQQLRF